MRLSLCMIVRDNADIIADCLTSIGPWVDEMVVVDTGSRDDTARIAAEAGATVSSFVWCDDFSAARNASFARASGEWLFWMDSDDVIDEANGRLLRELAQSDHDPSMLGYVMQVHCPGESGIEGGDVTVVDHVKLIRNRPELRFEGRIHEQILPAIRRAEGEVGWSDVFVTHAHGSVTTEAKAKKHRRDLRILELDLADRPEHPFVLFNLGMTYSEMEQPGKAADYLRRSIAAAGSGESHLRKAYALLIGCLLQEDQLDSAKRQCEEARRLFPEDIELTFRAGLIAQQAGRYEAAAGHYRHVLAADGDGERYFSSMDAGIRSYKTRHNLGVALSEQGRWGEAELQWRIALEEAPGFRAARLALVEGLLQQQKQATAQRLADQWLAEDEGDLPGALIKARLASTAGQVDTARRHLELARKADAADWRALDEWCRLMVENGRLPEAADALQELTQLRPDDAAALHNLGWVNLALQRIDAACQALRRSLALRPNHPPTQALLDEAQSRSG